MLIPFQHIRKVAGHSSLAEGSLQGNPDLFNWPMSKYLCDNLSRINSAYSGRGISTWAYLAKIIGIAARFSAIAARFSVFVAPSDVITAHNGAKLQNNYSRYSARRYHNYMRRRHRR